jgi:N-acetyl-alpha-D-muramate 1-phosphate uridylyltransferase
MKAMILAAGRGERMRPLTDHLPKPLLVVRGRALIDYHLLALARAGVTEVVINLFYHKEAMIEHIGDGGRYGLSVTYSIEDSLLETAGGIVQALPYLGLSPFLVISADIYTDFDYGALADGLPARLAHLVMVDNPAHHPDGDFGLGADGRLGLDELRLTYSGIGVFSPSLFANIEAGPRKLRGLMDVAVAKGHFTGERHAGVWSDVGTPDRLLALNR